MFAFEPVALDFVSAYSLAVEQLHFAVVAVLLLLNSHLDWADHFLLLHLALIQRMIPNLLAHLIPFYYRRLIEQSLTQYFRHLFDFYLFPVHFPVESFGRTESPTVAINIKISNQNNEFNHQN